MWFDLASTRDGKPSAPTAAMSKGSAGEWTAVEVESDS